MKTAVSLDDGTITVRMDLQEAEALRAFLDSDRNESARHDLYEQLGRAIQIRRKNEMSV